MSRCRNCNIEILDESEVCPLCHSVLEQTEELENMYPDARLKNQKLKFATRLYLFCALVLETGLVLLDFNGNNQVHWSILAGLGLLYVYTVLRYAVLGKSGYRAKTIVLLLLAILLTVAVDFTTGYRGWSVDYVVSGGILLMDAVILLLMMINRRNWQSYMMWQLGTILFGLIPELLHFAGLENNNYMAFLPLAVSAFLFLGTLMLGGRRAGQELYRRFHV